MGASSLILLIICAIVFSAGGIFASSLLAKHSKNSQKGQAYECGVPTIGQSWIQFNVGYYLFALLFLIFDVELVFLYPWAVVVKEIGMPALIEIIIFIFILFLGFLYAHRKGALKWM
jgi:NADH-quinone oxidoreductase subunit A